MQRHVLVLVTEDWFAVSHFLPLLRALVELGLRVTVATRCAGKEQMIEATGARAEHFDFKRGAVHPVRDAGVAVRLHGLIRRLRPDAVHAIAMKPIVTSTALAEAGMRRPLVLHLTGVGLAGTAGAGGSRLVHDLVMSMIDRQLARPDVHLLVENPDDRARFSRGDDAAANRITMLGGAGVDPDRFAVQPFPAGSPVHAAPVHAAYVGRMVWTKGVDVLVDAFRLVRGEGDGITLALCGAPDPDNPRAIARSEIEAWGASPGVSWHGFVTDITAVWRQAHFAVVPSRGGEGLPRALLEAAACGRAAIVSDVAGCRHFVRDGVEGLIVPAGDAAALARAIRRLAGDLEACRQMGLAARRRLLDGFTEQHLQAAMQNVYRGLLAM